MAATKLGLYELLAPQFLAGFTFPPHIDEYLAVLSVDTLRTVSDEAGVVYTGRLSFGGSGAGAPLPPLQHRDPNGGFFEWQDVTLNFRLTIPRDGAAIIRDAVGVLETGGAIATLRELFDEFGAVEQSQTGSDGTTQEVPTEYPGVRFRLELMLTALSFRLGRDFVSAKVENYRLVPDPALSDRPLKIVLPRIVMEYEQGDDPAQSPSFRLKSWGSSGFDAPVDLEAGELVRMEPPLAISRDGRWGFGIDQILLDLSQDYTPPEILQFFGTDEAFEGVYLKRLQFYYSDASKDFAFNAAIKDALISLRGEVWLEGSLDILGPETRMEVTVRLQEGDRTVEFNPGTSRTEDNGKRTIWTGGQARLSNQGVVFVQVRGGVPPYVITVKLLDSEGNEIAPDLWDSDRQDALISPGMLNAPPILRSPGRYRLAIGVEDGAPEASRRHYEQTLDPFVLDPFVTVGQRNGSSETGSGTSGRSPLPATFDLSEADRAQLRAAGYEVSFEILSGSNVRLTVRSRAETSPAPQITLAGTPLTLNNEGQTVIEVPEGSDRSVSIRIPDVPSQTLQHEVWFNFARPRRLDGRPDQSESLSNEGVLRNDRGTGELEQLKVWLKDVFSRFAPGSTISLTVDGHASYNGDDSRAQYNQDLSERRRSLGQDAIRQILSQDEEIRQILNRAGQTVDVSRGGAFGFGRARYNNPPETRSGLTPVPSGGRQNESRDEIAEITVEAPSRPGFTVTAPLRRRADSSTDTPRPPTPPTPLPTPPPNQAPPVFRRISFRVRIERNTFVLGELSGSLDFETELEGRLRNPQTEQRLIREGQLALRQPGANPGADDGVVDFRLTIVHDPATHQWSETLALGADPDDSDGLLEMTGDGSDVGKNIFGALLLFLPLINEAAAQVRPEQAGDWVLLAGTIAAPIAIGSLEMDGEKIFKTRKATLYGGELRARQFIPPEEVVSAEGFRWTDFGIIFDYGVSFDINFRALQIRTTRPLKVRYRAIGFNLHFGNASAGTPVTYQPIFDTSRGYNLDLSDPGLFNLPEPLGNILRVLGAQIARENPTTLEVDLGLRADLGVITVDRFKIKLPLDPVGAPTITPSGVRVNLAQVLIGSGSLQIGSDGSVAGAIDVSLVQLKIRIAAGLSIQPVSNEQGRKATAVLATLTVEFPSPIVLFSTGLGIYGFSGLFAMHYRRLEPERSPTDIVSPALRWLQKAGGDAARIEAPDRSPLWTPQLDRWSFGIGVILGTIEGGILLNFRGMFALELPGPRILIFVKIQILAKLPSQTDDPRQLTVGILGVIDLDFERGQLIVGVIVDLSIERLISIQLPIEILFKWSDPKTWHLWIGTHRQPASAQVLNLVRARGFLMIDGSDITEFPGKELGGRRLSYTLPGIAIATGIEAAIVLGSQDVGIYLRVAVGAYLGVSFSPLYLVGGLYLEGELRLIIIGIEARGVFTLEAGGLRPKSNPAEPDQPGPTIIRGSICGKIDLFFFSIEACVGLTIGEGERDLPAPALVRGLWLQSHAPVIVSGQGGATATNEIRPIDAKLGDAIALTQEGNLPPDSPLPTVPIDTILVLQLHASPIEAPATRTFTQSLQVPPGLTSEGWITVGSDRQIRYRLCSLTLTRHPIGSNVAPVSVSFTPPPPATWRRDRPPTTAAAPPAPPGTPTSPDTQIDLALFSWIPTTGSRALERSTDLNAQVENRWSHLCWSAAPPVCMLWTFCRQPLGPSGSGWQLDGIAQPDPPNTLRHAPPPTQLFVEEPIPDAAIVLTKALVTNSLQQIDIPAKVVGWNEATQTCVDFRTYPIGTGTNPRIEQGITFAVQGQPPRQGEEPNATRIASYEGQVGLSCHQVTWIYLPEAVSVVELTLVHFWQSPAAAIQIYSDSGQPQTMDYLVSSARQPQTLRLRAQSIRWIAIFNLLLGQQIQVLLLQKVCVPVQQNQNLSCFRALQLPSLRRHQAETIRQLPDDLQTILQEQFSQQWVTLHTGTAIKVSVFLAIAEPLLKRLVFRQIDEKNQLIAESRFYELIAQPVSGTTEGLPSEWLEPSQGWSREILPVASFLAGEEFRNLLRFVVNLETQPASIKIQIAVLPDGIDEVPQSVLIGAVVVCSQAEQNRAAEGAAIAAGELQTMTGYLQNDGQVPLLEPGQEYTLTVSYQAETRLRVTNDETRSLPPEAKPWGEPNETSHTQAFRFQTDTAPPSRLDPWLLGTSPDTDERYHFYEDPVKLLFNDLSAVQLFAQYGKRLQIVLRGADGVPVSTTGDTTIRIDSLDEVPATYSSPFREAIEQLIKERNDLGTSKLPCLSGVGKRPLHARFTAPFTLKPLMAYTLDVVAQPDDRLSSEQPITPLYRRSFSTSRFANLSTFAADIRDRDYQHRTLQRAIAPPPSNLLPGVPPEWNIRITDLSDLALQQLLTEAGERTLPAPEQPGITFYWLAAGTGWSLHALLIDTTEPMWRSRLEYTLQTVPDQDDPAFQQVVLHSVPALVVLEQGSGGVLQYIRSPGGTRTLILLNSLPAGTTLQLAFRKTRSVLYSSREELINPEQTEPFADILFTGEAPWESDDA